MRFKNESSSVDLALRILLFLACIPSGGALLAKVYGIGEMRPVTLFIFMPCAVFITAVWIWAGRSGHQELADRITFGFLGGLLGTFAYDLVRVPFLIAGQRVFAPITAYGVWIADAAMSSRFTAAAGWSYHFSNGITFGIMYALFMKRRHWITAVAWAFLLETIAIASPFSTIFSLKANYGALGIAYLGHVAYGLPLGWLTYRWDQTSSWLNSTPLFLKVLAGLLCLAAIAGPMVSPGQVSRDRQAKTGEFRVSGSRLYPDWQRINKDESIRVFNPVVEPMTVTNKDAGQTVMIGAAGDVEFGFAQTGIHQFYVETGLRTHSSFVIVEPVEEIAP